MQGAIKKSKSSWGFQVIISFSISQHSLYLVHLDKLSKYIVCGSVRVINIRPSHAEFIVYKFKDINDKIIPFLFFFIAA